MSDSANKNKSSDNTRRQRRGGRGGKGGGGGQGQGVKEKGDKGGGRGENKENEGGRGGGRVQRQRLESEMSDGGGDHCTVCLYKMNIYSIGECNHAVCHMCSTRMRVLIQRNECAICRSDLPKVILTAGEKKFDDIKDNIYQMDRKHKICFESDDIQKEYFRLLDHACIVCEEKPSFKTFRQLDNHMRSDHQMYYCDLCVSHLKSFSFERKFYDKAALMEHRRSGDRDDTSFKGHPLCEFCDKRWIDKDELYKHLRKDHYFCHFCDADGMQFFYSEYTDLRQHFKKDHFLCEEKICEEEKFVVFRSEIDIKAHTLERHGSIMSKAAKQENRRVDLDFSYNRRDARDGGREGGREERGYGREERGYGRGGGREDRGYGGREGGREERTRRDERPERRSPDFFDQLDGPARENVGAVPDMVADFPTLGMEANFPTLGAQAKAPNNKFEKSAELAKKLAAASGHNTGAPGQSWAGRGGAAPSIMEEFPSLPGAPKVSSAPRAAYKPAPSAASKRKPQVDAGEQFPGLPSRSGKPVPSSQFRPAPVRPAVAVRPAPAPVRSTPRQPPKPSRPKYDSDEDDYPTLGGTGRSLNNYSEKIVRNTGQDMDYSRTEHGGNINIVDQALIQALQGSKLSSKPMQTKVKVVNNTAEFPGLGPPEAAFSLNSKKNKKNKSKGPNNNNTSKSNGGGAPASLSSIADMLGPADNKKTNKPCDNPSSHYQAGYVADIKPIPSKLETVDVISRPSKQKQLPSSPKKQQKKSSPPMEADFPSLGSATKKISGNFVKAEDKLIKRPLPQSQWNSGLDCEASVGPEPSKARGRGPPGFRERFVFNPPPNFQKRNSALITTVSDCLGGKSMEFKRFRDTSVRFRAGDLKSEEYFGVCSKLFESEFTSFFPELLVLLPDIPRQGELLNLFKSKFETDLVQCNTCRQVLAISDVEEHSSSHNLDQDFPVLG